MRDSCTSRSKESWILVTLQQSTKMFLMILFCKPLDRFLFLDEPTSGLDSQTAWSIIALLRKLANNGQAILCTIHQPSAILFQEFNHLLFLASGGRTVYVLLYASDGLLTNRA